MSPPDSGVRRERHACVNCCLRTSKPRATILRVPSEVDRSSVGARPENPQRQAGRTGPPRFAAAPENSFFSSRARHSESTRRRSV